MNRPEWSFRMWSNHMDQPAEVSVETLALCNAHCEFCPYGTLEREGVKMPDETLDRLLDEMQGWHVPFYFSPFKVNEPLLDKRVLPSIRKLATNKVANFRLFTNGAALNDRNVDEIAALPRLAHLWISLNYIDPEQYEASMKISWKRTTSNLDRLHQRTDFPWQVVVSTVGNPNVEFQRYCNYRWPRFTAVALKRNSWLGFTTSDDQEVPETPCMRWFELNIAATGVATLCCMDGEGKFPIGDVNESTLSDIYNTPHWRERRQRLMNRRNVYPCNTCTY